MVFRRILLFYPLSCIWVHISLHHTDSLQQITHNFVTTIKTSKCSLLIILESCFSTSQTQTRENICYRYLFLHTKTTMFFLVKVIYELPGIFTSSYECVFFFILFCSHMCRMALKVLILYKDHECHSSFLKTRPVIYEKRSRYL